MQQLESKAAAFYTLEVALAARRIMTKPRAVEQPRTVPGSLSPQDGECSPLPVGNEETPTSWDQGGEWCPVSGDL